MGWDHAAAAPSNETRVRSASSIYSSPSNGRGTVTGATGDLVVIKDKNGKVKASRTSGYWKNHRNSAHVADVVDHRNGTYSIRLCYFTWSGIKGGTVEVQSGGRVIDRDRLR